MTAAALPALFDELSFGGEWRRYQKAAIAAFERDRAPAGGGRTSSPRPARARRSWASSSYAVSVGARSCSLPMAPSRCSGREPSDKFAPASEVVRTAGPEPAFPIACMTYQSLCQLDDPERW